ncbi:MAG: tetratricopeptide repeat protein [Candidatus Thermoplasmatota archaeon]|nr:tetratricopeptide repeat protein [Candidatus Thermoplasmatota archaeon]
MDHIRKREEFILLAIGSFNLFGVNHPPGSEALRYLLGIQTDTLNRHMKHLRDMGMIEEQMNAFYFTAEGAHLHERLYTDMMDRDLIPEKNSTSGICQIRTIMPLIKDQKSYIEVAAAIRQNKCFDIIDYLNTKKALRPGSEERLKMDEILDQGVDAQIKVDDLYSGLSMLGIKPEQVHDTIDPSKVSDNLIIAEVKRRGSKIEEAFSLFDGLRSEKSLTPGHWIVCLIGCMECLKAIKGPESALNEVVKLLKRVKDPFHKALLLYLQADILSDMRDHDKATRLYRTSEGMMKALNMQRTRTELCNSLGVHYFRQRRFNLAERTWKRALILTNKYDLIWTKALIEINLADCESMKGNHRTAWNKIRRAEEILRKYDDLEGLADIEYNKALLYIRQGKIDKAYDSYDRAEAYPLRYAKKKDEWQEVLNECLVENGYPPRTFAYIKPPLSASEKQEKGK